MNHFQIRLAQYVLKWGIFKHLIEATPFYLLFTCFSPLPLPHPPVLHIVDVDTIGVGILKFIMISWLRFCLTTIKTLYDLNGFLFGTQTLDLVFNLDRARYTFQSENEALCYLSPYWSKTRREKKKVILFIYNTSVVLFCVKVKKYVCKFIK